jgi:thiol-disulfide isomerase/thioredoxin
MSAVRHGVRIVGTAVAVFALLGCTSETEPDSGATYTFDAQKSDVDVDTPALRSAKAAAGIQDCPPSDLDAKAVEGGVPALVLPCLGGGDAVNLAGLGKPAVLNMWAQYCGPCRTEAPIFQRVHESAGDDVAIIGVDWQDPLPAAAIAFADELGLTYPQLADPETATRIPLRIQALPVTVFVAADGTVTHVEYGAVNDVEDLKSLIVEHLDVDLRR